MSDWFTMNACASFSIIEMCLCERSTSLSLSSHMETLHSLCNLHRETTDVIVSVGNTHGVPLKSTHISILPHPTPSSFFLCLSSFSLDIFDIFTVSITFGSMISNNKNSNNNKSEMDLMHSVWEWCMCVGEEIQFSVFHTQEWQRKKISRNSHSNLYMTKQWKGVWRLCVSVCMRTQLWVRFPQCKISVCRKYHICSCCFVYSCLL